MRTLHKIGAAGIIFVMASSLTRSEDLNSSASSAKQGIRAEIFEGANRVFDCVIMMAGKTPAQVSHCVERMYLDMLKRGTAADGYALGVCHYTWLNMAERTAIGTGDWALTVYYYDKFTGYQKKLGITDMEICEAAGVSCSSARRKLTMMHRIR